MMEEKQKVEYDDVYPPLNGPAGCFNAKAPPKISAFKKAMEESFTPKCIVIPPRERRFMTGDANLEKHIQELKKQFEITLVYKVTNLGNLLIDHPRVNMVKDEKYVDFCIRETLSKQVKEVIKINDERFVKKFADKKYQQRLCEDLVATLRVDFGKKSVVVEGGKESVDKIVTHIRDFINWNTDLDKTRLDVHAMYFSFVRGEDNSTINEIIESSGKYVNVTFNPDDNKITLDGNKKCVASAKRKILEILKKLDELEQFQVNLNQNQYDLIREKIPECTVNEAYSVTFVKQKNLTYICHVIGCADKVDRVKTMIGEICSVNYYERIPCEFWICQILLGYPEMSSTFYKLFPKATMTILPQLNCIEISCEIKDINEPKRKVTGIIEDITKSMHHDTFHTEKAFVSFLESKQSERMKEIQNQSDTLIYCEYDSDQLNTSSATNAHLHVIGIQQQTAIAMALLKEYYAFHSSYTTKEADIPSYLHKYFVGPKEKDLKQLVESNSKNCTVSFVKNFGDSATNKCVIHGPTSEVSTLISAIQTKIASLAEIHRYFSIEIPHNISSIFLSEKQTIIAKINSLGGKLESFSISDKSPVVISCVGKKELVEKSRNYLESLLQCYSKSISKQVALPEKYIPFLTIFGNEIIKVIKDGVGGGLDIKLPKSITSKEKIEFYGPASAVDNAIDILKKYNAGNDPHHFMEMVKIPKAYTTTIKNSIFKMIGTSGVKVYFQSQHKNDQTNLLVVGEMANVNKVKSDILSEIDTIQNTTEKVIHVKADYKKEFLKKRKNEATLVQKLSSEHGNVRISIGDKSVFGEDFIPITMKGNKKHVESLEAALQELFKVFEKRIQKMHSFTFSELNEILSANRHLLKNCMDRYGVIMSVSQNYYDNKVHANQTKSDKETCSVYIKGFPEEVEPAYEYVKSWKMTSIDLDIPIHAQQHLLSKHAQHINTLRHNLGVTITFGASTSTPRPVITISGLESNVNEALTHVRNISDLNYELHIKVPQIYFTRLIGKRGVHVQKINTDFQVKVFFPSDEDSEDVVIYGAKDACTKASEKIMSMVEEWKSIATLEMLFDSRVKLGLLGNQNSNLRTIGNKFNVQIKLMATDQKSPPTRKLKISGLPQNIAECQEHIKATVNSLIDELDEQYQYHPPINNAYELDLSSLNSMVFVEPNKQAKSKQSKLNNNQTQFSGNHSNNQPQTDTDTTHSSSNQS